MKKFSSREEAILDIEKELLELGYVKDKDNVYKFYKGDDCIGTITIKDRK